MVDEKRGPGRPAGPAHRSRSVRLHEAAWEALDAAAKAAGKNANAIIKALVDEYIAAMKRRGTSQSTSQNMKPASADHKNKT